VDITSESVRRGIRERAATIVGSHGEVPVALWLPELDPPSGLVLIGHGGSAHKGQDYVVALARHLVHRSGVAVAAIDGPVHGARRAIPDTDPSLVLLEFAQLWGRDPSLTDRMLRDWTATLDELTDELAIDGLPVGYWGISMGTLFGLPFVAADERIRVCVLGLAGITGPSALRLADDAPKVRVPVLFLVQLDDQLFTTASSLELFGALGSSHKRLYASPGRHNELPQDAFTLSIDFLVEQLATAGAPEPVGT
jgi:pimeloyl-ACP methyl ester carboxylesterase